jgi:hypothetical protein
MDNELFKTPNGAHISECGKYRYALWRSWEGGNGKYVNFVMLNPSTADATINDATIRLCIGYAKRWGYSGIVVTNLYAYRATDPKDLFSVAADLRRGKENAYWLALAANGAGLIVAAWGNHGTKDGRSLAVRQLFQSWGKTMFFLRVSKNGEPCHPLRLPKSLIPTMLSNPDQEPVKLDFGTVRCVECRFEVPFAECDHNVDPAGPMCRVCVTGETNKVYGGDSE